MAGQRIDDHGSWIGQAPKGQVFPHGVKLKNYDSAEGDGGIKDYPDTTEAVKRDQEGGVRKSREQKMPSGYRY